MIIMHDKRELFNKTILFGYDKIFLSNLLLLFFKKRIYTLFIFIKIELVVLTKKCHTYN